MKPSFYISSRKVGYDEDPLVIAEIGINHNGSLNIAKHMAKTAIDAGVHIVKHQTHIVDDEMSHEADKAHETPPCCVLMQLGFHQQHEDLIFFHVRIGGRSSLCHSHAIMQKNTSANSRCTGMADDPRDVRLLKLLGSEGSVPE